MQNNGLPLLVDVSNAGVLQQHGAGSEHYTYLLTTGGWTSETTPRVLW